MFHRNLEFSMEYRGSFREFLERSRGFLEVTWVFQRVQHCFCGVLEDLTEFQKDQVLKDLRRIQKSSKGVSVDSGGLYQIEVPENSWSF